MAEIAKRHRRAVELLAPQRGESVLEVGCGHGIATGLMLAAGARVVAVDRSGKMVAACNKRNRDKSRLTTIAADFEQLDLGMFDAACAVNVDFTRHDAGGWAAAFRKAVKAGGRIVLVLDAPTIRTAERFALQAAASLAGVGFEVDTQLVDGVVAVTGRRLG